MCLIIAGKSNQIRATLLNTPDLLANIYDANADGIGAMYVSAKGRLRTPKLVPKNLNQFTGFIRQLPDDERNIAIHARYKTHGDIDLENCHPYTVLPNRVAMMHNGILSHGNKEDKRKSDTWHYIKNVVRPQLEGHPKLFTLPSWITLIEADITSANRFVFMDDAGEMVIANRRTGIEHEGMWFSNTYAWSPELLIPTYKPATVAKRWPGFSSLNFRSGRNQLFGMGFLGADPDEPDDEDYALAYADPDEWGDDVHLAVVESDVAMLDDYLSRRPYTTLRTLFDSMNFTCHVDPRLDLVGMEKDIVGFIEQAQLGRLADMITQTPSLSREIAEAMCWQGEWNSKPAPTKVSTPPLNPLRPLEMQAE